MFTTGMGTFGTDESPEETPFDNPEGLSGVLFSRPVLLAPLTKPTVGDAGRLAKLLFIGVMGALDGRSIGTIKLRNAATSDVPFTSLRVSLPYDG